MMIRHQTKLIYLIIIKVLSLVPIKQQFVEKIKSFGFKLSILLRGTKFLNFGIKK